MPFTITVDQVAPPTAEQIAAGRTLPQNMQVYSQTVERLDMKALTDLVNTVPPAPRKKRKSSAKTAPAQT